ncbi:MULTISPECIES: hypothetical protein [Ensifer]|uniref:hypothetical protein n=1 Tax=Ensifer TaxID=106591 RepID=UPI00070D9E5E|nr:MULTISPECIES: hypothetical protein [Ensifer]KQW72593.1 hypothetical protein ASD03_31495 [Ensifer sp. Root127]
MKFAIAGVASLAFAGSAFAAVPSMSVEKKAGAKATYQIELAGGPSRSRGSISEGNSSGQNRSGKTTYSK